jgi:hypothetical protein
MRWREMPLAHFKALTDELFGFIVLRLIGAQLAERDQAFGYFGAVWTEECLAPVESRMQQRIGLIKLAQLLVDGSERLVELRLYFAGCKTPATIWSKNTKRRMNPTKPRSSKQSWPPGTTRPSPPVINEIPPTVYCRT